MSGPVPITTQEPRPTAGPVSVGDVAARIAGATGFEGVWTHEEIAALRFEFLDMHGLTSIERIESGECDRTIEAVLDELVDNALALARATTDRLAADAVRSTPPVVLRHDRGDVTRLVGQTMLWADHYLVDDQLAAVAHLVRQIQRSTAAR